MRIRINNTEARKFSTAAYKVYQDKTVAENDSYYILSISETPIFATIIAEIFSIKVLGQDPI
jgi:hypothetical protein